jgi:predicted Zn-dependent protease
MAGGFPMGGDARDPRAALPRGCLMRLAPLAIAGVVAAVVAYQSCQPGPFGRHQIVALDPQQEQQLGLQAYQEVLGQSDVVRDGPAVEAVREITRRLVRATSNPDFLRITGLSKPPDFQWDVKLVRDQQVNAFCLPGGKMVVYTAILPVAKTHAGLATVMGHEISHALAHHGAERMAQTQIANILMTGAAGSLGDMDPGQRQQVMQVLNAGAQFGILKYSRKHESEADHMGLFLMAAAGYDPQATVQFWERMQAATKRGGGTPEFMSTHPSHETRIRDLHNWLPEAEPLARADPAPDNDEPLPTGGRP